MVPQYRYFNQLYLYILNAKYNNKCITISILFPLYQSNVLQEITIEIQHQHLIGMYCRPQKKNSLFLGQPVQGVSHKVSGDWFGHFHTTDELISVEHFIY